MGRGTALLLSALLLLASGGCTTGTDRSTAPFAPPPGQRWAGEGLVVVAVPADWRTVDDPVCGPPPSRTVIYPNPDVHAYGCTSGGPHRPPSYLAIVRDADLSPSVERTSHPIDVGGLHGYAWNHSHRGYAGLTFPSERVTFSLSTPDRALAHRILHSAAVLPPGYVTIPPIGDGTQPSAGMIERLHQAGLRPTYAEEPGRRSTYPGRFLRTDPPVGSAVLAGASVTAFHAAGVLTSWITGERLAARGWSLTPPTSFSTLITRDHALAILGLQPDRRPAFLRTVTLDGRTRQAWVVVQHPQYGHPGWAVRLALVDATTGQIVRKHVLFPSTLHPE